MSASLAEIAVLERDQGSPPPPSSVHVRRAADDYSFYT